MTRNERKAIKKQEKEKEREKKANKERIIKEKQRKSMSEEA